MLNELLPLLRGPPRKSFRSYGSLEASVPVKSAGMWRTLREGKRVREGPGNEGGKGPHRGRNTRPGREGWRCPGSRPPIPNPGSRSRPHLGRRHRPRARTAARPPRLAGSNARGAASPTCAASPPPRGLPGVVVRRSRGGGAVRGSVPSPRPTARPVTEGPGRRLRGNRTGRCRGEREVLLGFSSGNG